MKKSSAILLFALGISISANAELVARKMEVPFFCNSGTVLYLALHNPSNAKQEVQVDFEITKGDDFLKSKSGTYYFKEAGSHTAHNNLKVAAASLKPQTATTDKIYLEIGRSTQSSIVVDGNLDSEGYWGCKAIISVWSEKGAGYLKGDGIVTTSGTPHSLLVNSGRPF